MIDSFLSDINYNAAGFKQTILCAASKIKGSNGSTIKIILKLSSSWKIYQIYMTFSKDNLSIVVTSLYLY